MYQVRFSHDVVIPVREAPTIEAAADQIAKHFFGADTGVRRITGRAGRAGYFQPYLHHANGDEQTIGSPFHIAMSPDAPPTPELTRDEA